MKLRCEGIFEIDDGETIDENLGMKHSMKRADMEERGSSTLRYFGKSFDFPCLID